MGFTLRNAEWLKQRILEKRGNLTLEELDKLIEDKKRGYSGFLSDEGALRILCHELLIPLGEGRILSDETPIKNLVAGLNDVSVAGRVVAAWPPKQFTKEDGSPGSLTRFVLADKTGMVTCAAWNRNEPALMKTEELTGKLVKINHGYTKTSRGGEVELHVGDRGLITISPKDLDEKDYPKIEETIQSVDEIDEKLSRVNLQLTLKSNPTLTKFPRDDGEGLVSKVKAADETGEITVVAWDEEAENLSKASIGDKIRIINGRLRKGLNNSLEVHITKTSLLTPLGKEECKSKPYTPIAHLNSGLRNIQLKAKVVSVKRLEEPASGKLRMVQLLLGDETGLIPATAWGEKPVEVKELTVGNTLTLIDVDVVERSGYPRLALRSYTKVSVEKNEEAKLPKPLRLSEIKGWEGLITVEGTLSSHPEVRDVKTSRGEAVKLTRIILREEEVEAEVTLWRGLAEEGARLKMGDRVRLIGVKPESKIGGRWRLTSLTLTRIEVFNDGERGKMIRGRPFHLGSYTITESGL